MWNSTHTESISSIVWTCEQYIAQQNCRHNEKYNNNLLLRNLWYDPLKLMRLKKDAKI